MTTFKTFLLYEGRTSQLNESEAIKWIGENCPIYANHVINTEPQIYRGVDEVDTPFLFGNSLKGEPRASVNTTNFYTLLIDHLLPAWNQFPKRSRSFISASSDEIAGSYGIPYAAFPADGTDVGIASNDDIWNSFKYMENHLGKGVYLNEFNNMLEIIIEQTLHSKTSAEPKSATELVQLINHVQKMLNENGDEFVNKFMESSNPRIQAMVRPIRAFFEFTENRHDNSIRGSISDLLDPKKNGFQLGKSHKLAPEGQKELWFSGPAIFIGIDHHDPQQIAKEAIG